MLEIKDLSKLKITKVKDWAVYFDYDGEKYLLHGRTEDYEYDITLYKRMPLNDKGKYKLEYIFSKISTSDYIKSIYIKYFSKQMCYKHIDKEYFVKKLTYYGYCYGMYEEYVKNLKRKVDIINSEIEMFENSIRDLQLSKRELLEMKER